MKKLFFIGACLVALGSTPVMAQTGKQEVIMVRVRESNGDTHLSIERVGQAPEEVTFEWSDRTGKNMSAAKGYLSALDKLFQQGFQIQAVIPGYALTTPGGIAFSTLVFIKAAGK
jgi:hypothetical protein